VTHADEIVYYYSYHQEEFRQMVEALIASYGASLEEESGKKIWKSLKGFVFSRICHMRQLSAHLFLGDQLIRTFWKKDAFDKVIPQLPQNCSMANSVLHNQLKKYQQRAEKESQISHDATAEPEICGKCAELPSKAHRTEVSFVACLDLQFVTL
jgi:hypothetical protein